MSIKRFKQCHTCGKQEPRGWSEPETFQCARCHEIAHNAVTQSDEQLRQGRRIHDMVQRWDPQRDAQRQAAKAAQHRDPRAAQMARAMANDPRPAARGTQQDPISDPMHILNPLNPLSPVSPLNPLNDWDSSSHRNHSSASSCDDSGSSYHHTSHDSGSSYDSGSDSSSYTSGGCD